MNIIEQVLLYFNSVEQVVLIFAKLSQKFRFNSIRHLSSRLVLMSEETKRYEEAYEDLVTGIKIKRERFYRDYH